MFAGLSYGYSDSWGCRASACPFNQRDDATLSSLPTCHLFECASVRSPFSLDDFLCGLSYGAESKIITEIHVVVLRALTAHHLGSAMEDDTGEHDHYLLCWMSLDGHNWPELLRRYGELYVSQPLAEVIVPMALAATESLQHEYWSLPIYRKIQILRFMCEAMIDVPVRRRPGWRTCLFSCSNGRMLSHLGSQAIMDEIDRRASALETRVNADDGKLAECVVCGDGGELLCCDGCCASFHQTCIRPVLAVVPGDDDEWFCGMCSVEDACSVSLTPVGSDKEYDR